MSWVKRHWLTTIIALIVVIGAGLAWRLVSKNIKPASQTTAKPTTAAVPDEPLLLKSVGFNLGYYNPATNRAGDMEFTLVDHGLSGHIHQIWQDFGQQDYRSPNDPTKKNPQPVYVLPLHTKVLSLVTGEIVDVKTLYSNDYTIWAASSPSSHYIYETEHVDNPVVKKGDKVVGGQVIAEVSSKDSDITPGFGLLEIGILYTANPNPQHLCPYQYFDPSVKADLNQKITALHSAWEKFYGQKVYLENFVTPGCVSETPVNG
ncbi:MAG TPA: hypothetical protein VLE93_00865 [Candidatus Saccharimonadales bacterium]|nr:hypothetical protein [Candidatus Saccharimonadales bacterium]